MEKIKFETKEEFLNYCKENEVCNIPRRFLSQWTYFVDGVERKTWFDNGNSIYVGWNSTCQLWTQGIYPTAR